MSLGSLTKDIFEAQEILSAFTCSCCLNGGVGTGHGAKRGCKARATS